MSLSLSRENGKVMVENRFYVVSFSARRGMVNYLWNNKAERSLVFREGCEIWCPKWGGFTQNHYQQEKGGSAKFNFQEEASTIKVKVESKLGNAGTGNIRGGWCINNWTFKRDTPLIYCNAQIGDPDAEQPETAKPNQFKKYICFYPGSYRYWAYKDEDEVVSGILGWNNLTPHFEKWGHGYRLKLDKGWLTLFNDDRGFAFTSIERAKTCEYLALWQSREMNEILCSCHSGEKSQSLSLGYLEYATTPKKKWTPVDDVHEGKGISKNT